MLKLCIMMWLKKSTDTKRIGSTSEQKKKTIKCELSEKSASLQIQTVTRQTEQYRKEAVHVDKLRKFKKAFKNVMI